MTMSWNDREKRYDYLSAADSALYISVKDSTDPKDAVIKSLIEKIAAGSRQAHCNARY